jgi:hypothetical protein
VKAAKESKEERMNKTIGMIAAPTIAMTLADAALLAGVLLGLAASPAFATDLPNKGTMPYVTHFVFRPLMNVDVPGVGSVTTLEAVGTTENLKGEKMLDKMSARCQALRTLAPRNISTAPACWPTPTATRSSRPSTRAISISRSLI